MLWFESLVYSAYNNALLIAFVLGIILLIILCRSLILWYYGITQIHRNQEETIKLLRIIANQNRPKPPSP